MFMHILFTFRWRHHPLGWEVDEKWTSWLFPDAWSEYRSCFTHTSFVRLVRRKWSCSLIIRTTTTIPWEQARNQLGTTGGAKSFPRGAQNLWTMSNILKLCPTHFSGGGAKNFLGGLRSPCAPLVTGLPGSRPNEPILWLEVFLSSRLLIEYLEPLIDFPVFLVPNFGPKFRKLISDISEKCLANSGNILDFLAYLWNQKR